MLKILTIVALVRSSSRRRLSVVRSVKLDGLTEVMVHTGQHFDPNMSDVFFEELDISKPQHHLDIRWRRPRRHDGTDADRDRANPDRGEARIGLSSTVIPTRHWPARSPHRSCIFRSRMLKRGCVRSIAACRRKSTGLSPTISPH